jgi:hypothetical protein
MRTAVPRTEYFGTEYGRSVHGRDLDVYFW